MRSRLHRRRLSAALAAAVSAIAVAALPGAAQAASVSYAKGTIKYTAVKGEANHVVVQPIGYALVVSDSGARSVRVGAGCYQASSSAVACPLNAANLSADLGDGNDFFDASLGAVPVSVAGGAGNDSLHGGTGIDTLDGGSEDDSIDARDAVADSIVCGTGSDGGYADDLDTLAADCESVQRPSAPPATIAPPVTGPVVDPAVDPAVDPVVDPAIGPGTTDPGTVTPDNGKSGNGQSGNGQPGDGHPGDGHPGDSQPGNGQGTSGNGNPASGANAVPASIPAQTVGVSASGVASVRVDCPADSGGCSGTVSLVLPVAGSTKRRATLKAARAAAPLPLGHAKFKAKAGTSPVVPVRLSKRGRQRILRSRHGKRARIVITTRRADGNTTTVSQDVTIRLKRQAAKRRRSVRR